MTGGRKSKDDFGSAEAEPLSVMMEGLPKPKVDSALLLPSEVLEKKGSEAELGRKGRLLAAPMVEGA